MAEILPAILPENWRDLGDKVLLMANRVPLVHIDVTDATLTKEANWPYRNNNGEWENIVNESEGLPHWEDMNFEAHLMVRDAEARGEEWIRAGAERIIVHIEAFDTSEALSAYLSKFKSQFGMADNLKIDLGLALNFQTPVSKLLPHILECDFIHLMSESVLGEQGHPFEEGIFDKIKELKLGNPDVLISVDGGVSVENAGRLVEAGVERLVVGSAIFAAPDPLMALEDLTFEIE
jgi:pentose-5-phosphate-3-epimerase